MNETGSNLLSEHCYKYTSISFKYKTAKQANWYRADVKRN